MPSPYRTILFVCITLTALKTYGQDNCITISMPDSVSGCPDSVASVSATISVAPGSIILDTVWDPATGISDIHSLSPTFTGTKPVTYTLKILTLTDSDAIVNGNFDSGTTGFTSSYAVESSGTYPGHYAVTRTLVPFHYLYPAAMGDHTTGRGYMLFVDGGLDPTAPFWCESVPVKPDHYYTLSLWVSKILDPAARLSITINNRQVIDSALSDSVSVWDNYKVTWYNSTSNKADICMYSMNPAAEGNDFVIDDISFKTLCTSSKTLYVDLCNPPPIPHIFGVPNAFSPNGDGKNDILKAHGANIISFKMSIYNRWGNKVFETSDLNNGWDGTFNGAKQPADTYTYYAEMTFKDRQSQKKEGYIILLR